MVNEKHLNLIKKGVTTWNEWRSENTNRDLLEPDLFSANLFGADLHGADLRKANFSRVDLSRANLSETDLRGADISEANLNRANLSKADIRQANLNLAYLRRAHLNEPKLIDANLNGADLNKAEFIKAQLNGADLRGASLVETNFEKADLTGCRIYGISAWNTKLQDTAQSNLIITPVGESTITVDNLEVAQFVYLLLKNEKIRDVINTIGKKAVLILGRFTPERKIVLEAIRKELRRLNYVPILFDFEKPTDRDFTETIMTLAGMCRFIIADITNPKSSPLELQATVPNYMIPFVPIIQEGEEPFSMFKDLANRHEWVLDMLVYDSLDNLVIKMENAVIKPALKKHDELMVKKAKNSKTRHINDYC